MKKLVFLLLLLFPFMVRAVENVKITNIEQIEKSETVTVKTDPTFEGLKINFDFKFTNLNDFIKYKVTIKNEDNKDYEIESGVSFNEGEYIKYEFGMNGDSAIIKPGESKEMSLKITYVKEPSPEYFVDGSYVEQNSMTIDLSSSTEQKSSVDPASQKQEDNPHTGATSVLIFITILLVSGVILTVAIRKNDKVLMTLVLLLIPISIYAIEKITLEIETKIELVATEKTLKVVDYNCGFGEPKTYEFTYKNGMTWGVFKDSNYYTLAREKYTLEELPEHSFEYILTPASFEYNEIPQCFADLGDRPIFEEEMTEEEQAELEAYDEATAKCEEEYKTHDFSNEDFIQNSSVGNYYVDKFCTAAA